MNVTPLGIAPDSLSVGVGLPVAVTLNIPAIPTAKVVLDELVIAGACVTVSVRLTLAVCAVGVLESLTLNVSEVLLGPVGVPLITPVDAFSVKGLGSVPVVIVHT